MLLAGCAPIVESVSFKDVPPKAAEHRLFIYRGAQTPKCPYSEIGRVTAIKRNGHVSTDDTMNAFKARVRQMGGDGVVGMVIVNEASNIPFRDPTIVGTAIVFTDAQCQEPEG